MKLKGRGVLITGASQGFGRAVANACVADGADVLLCARGKDELEAVREELASTAAKGQRVFACQADISREEDVRSLVESAAKRLPRLMGLVNNAGVYGPMGLIEELDFEEWIRAIEINLLGTVRACRAVLPTFRSRGYGKIVNLSGGGATAPMPRFSAYAASKAAVVRFTETLAGETRGAGIDVNAIAPGALNTRLLTQVLNAGPAVVGQDFYDRAIQQNEQGGAPVEKGAALTVYLLSGESDGITGRLISAIWDQWPSLHEKKPELDRSDVYTLRRIVPKDRGLPWD